ncbi:hypothetical protein CIHG_00024 [Coccidioides immitis H538.4]|uniref:Transcription initiation factor TFIID subunit 4 n=1 Tax=Coccidioides immitis H538.4 TaxID=396776 RepID=A0A0J8U5G2_COCIT|nr:hypothetical protein CIHG_00024 [Coccidioides immitis H538.4]
MAQTQSHQFPSQSSFSPPASTPSPSPSSTGTPSGNLGPPPKRQRLSPLPQTQAPFSSSPGFGTLQLPQTTSPVNGVPVANMTNPPGNAVHLPPQPQPQPQTHTPQPPPPPGSMGPPSRPAETKPTDAAELTDVLASSGIDVREEEAFLPVDMALHPQLLRNRRRASRPILPLHSPHCRPLGRPHLQEIALLNPLSASPLSASTHGCGAHRKGKEDQNGIAAASPNGTSQKRTISTNRDDSNEARRITFPNTLAMKSRRLIEKDGSYEEGRANKRMKRNTDAILSGDTGRSASVGPGAEPSGERAPDVEKKTKKELKKAEAKVNDAVQHQHAVETARMATGGLSTSRFGGKKTYSWLSNPSATSASRTSFSNPSRARPGGGSAPSGTGKPGGLSNGIRVPPGKRLGEWREDKDRGAGVQIRDILSCSR